MSPKTALLTAAWLLLAALLGLLAPQPTAWAQGTGGSGQKSQQLTKAPVLIKQVEPAYPPQAIEAKIEGQAKLKLTIDAQGKVSNAEVVEDPGGGLGEAARQAALQFEFEPAEIDGQPAPVALGFAITFALPTQPSAFRGEVVDQATGRPIEGAQVSIEYVGKELDETPQATTTTDAEGTFFFENVPPGPYRVTLRLDEYRDYETEIDLAPGEEERVTYKPQAAPVNYQITVREAGTRTPLPGIEAELTEVQSAQVVRRDFTGEGGRLGFRGLTPGRYRLRLSGEGYNTAIEVESVEANEVLEATYYVRAEVYDPYSVRTTAEREVKEVNRRTLKLEEVRRLPGTQGDVVRVVQNLPGVARPSFLSGLVIVRGGAPRDTLTFLEGDLIPLVYHFFGGPAVVNSEMIESIDFYPGNFSTYYGRATAGIIELNTRSPRTDRLHGLAEIDLLKASLLIEGPTGIDDLSFAVSGRRSYFDAFLPYIIPEDAFDVFVAPVYYDYQGWLTYRGFKDSVVELFLYGSNDTVEAIFPGDEPQGNENFQFDGINLDNGFHRGQLRWEWRPAGEPLENTLLVSYGTYGTGIEASEDIFFDLAYNQSLIRDDLRLQLADNFRLRLGLDFLLGNVVARAEIPGFEREDDQRDGTGGAQDGTSGQPFFSEGGFSLEQQQPLLLPAFYTEATWEPVEGLELIPGLRFDWYGTIREGVPSPRLTTRYKFNEEWLVKGGAGLFTQPPLPGTTERPFGNPNLEEERAWQYALGTEWTPLDYLKLDVTGFLRFNSNLVVNNPRISLDQAGGGDEVGYETWSNEGAGRAYGLEVLLRHDTHARFFGWLAYTLSRAERLNLVTDEYNVYRYDQTHILTAVAGYNLPWDVDVSARFRLVTGNPYTPIVGSVWDADADEYVEIYGEPYSARNATFHQLDVRVDKRFVFDTWMLGIFLDVINVYNQTNAEGQSFNYDFTDQQPVPGLPIIPTLGINARF